MKLTFAAFALIALALAAAPSRAGSLATLDGMSAGGSDAQAAAFTGGQAPAGVVAPSASKPSSELYGARTATVPKDLSPKKEPPSPSPRQSRMDGFVGGVAATVGGAWIGLGLMTMMTVGVTFGTILPVVVGAAAIAWGVSVLRGKIRLN